MVLFDSLCQAALESHARASVLTGLDTAAHGLWTDGVALPEREITLMASFAAQGYRSWHVGRRQLAGVSHFTTEHARAGECHAQDWAHGPAHRSRQNAYLNWLQATAPDIYSSVFPRQPNPDDTALSAAQHAQLADLPDELSFNVWAGGRAVSHLEAVTTGQPFFGLAQTPTRGVTVDRTATRLGAGALPSPAVSAPERAAHRALEAGCDARRRCDRISKLFV